MARQHHPLHGQEFEQTLEDSEERLAGGRPWDSKVGHDLATEQQQPLVVVREALNQRDIVHGQSPVFLVRVFLIVNPPSGMLKKEVTNGVKE